VIGVAVGDALTVGANVAGATVSAAWVVDGRKQKANVNVNVDHQMVRRRCSCRRTRMLISKLTSPVVYASGAVATRDATCGTILYSTKLLNRTSAFIRYGDDLGELRRP